MPDAPRPLPPEAPPPGTLREIQPGLLRARMPLPFPPGHVNLWFLEQADGWLAIDTGIASEPTQAIWEQLLAQPALGGRPLSGLLITHFHPDHSGLAAWLGDRFGLAPMMTRIEWLMGRALWHDVGPGMVAQQVAHFARAGCSAEYLAFIEQRGAMYRRSVQEPSRAFHAIRDGETRRIGGTAWRVITGAGHAPDMITLHAPERDLLIAADQILPRISPFIGLHPNEPEADPLGDFLASNERFRSLPETTLVLPSHGEPFVGLHARLDSLAAHHAERLERLSDICRAPVTAFVAAQGLFPRAAAEQTQIGFAVGETLAHLRRLERQGWIEAEPGPDGALRWRQRG